LQFLIDICDFATNNINKSNANFIEEGRVKIICKDGTKGHVEEGPYDIIHFGFYKIFYLN
jgi:protein-L-isoaspartate O-methyltransferase